MQGRWQRRTLPPRYQGSTIRAGELNFRVRDVAGWTLAAPTTNFPASLLCTDRVSFSHRFESCHFLTPRCCCLLPASIHFSVSISLSSRPLVRMRSRHCCPSTFRLSNSSSSSGLTLLRVAGLILGSVSHLDAFSGSPLRRSLPGTAPGGTTGTRALRPARSSRTRASSPQTPFAHSG